MFSLISKCADHLEHYVEKLADRNEAVECRELTAKYTTDVIGTCAFGIEMNALSDEDSEFRKMGRSIFAPTWCNLIRATIRRSMPWLYRIFNFLIPQTETTKFFMRILAENIAYREKNNIVRHDFVDVLKEMKKHPDKMPNISKCPIFVAQIFFFLYYKRNSSKLHEINLKIN
jgi:cytochrome P450 family 6